MTTEIQDVSREITNPDPQLYNHDLALLEDLYTMSPSGVYWYSHGFNLSAVYALIGASLISFLCVMVPAISWLANFSWFIGVFASALFYRMLTLGVKSVGAPAMIVTGSPGSAGEAR